MLPENREPELAPADGVQHAGKIPRIDVVADCQRTVFQLRGVFLELVLALNPEPVTDPVERNEQAAETYMIERLIETILETVAYLLIRESPVKRDLPAVISDREDVLVRTVDRILYIDVGDVNSIPCFHLPISFVINTFTHDALKFLQLANIAIFPFR